MSAIILYVDSDAGARRAHKLLLESVGYQVLTAETAAEAYRIFTSAPDLVIAEYQLAEDTTGSELAARLKTVRPNLPIVLLSATAEKPAGLDHVEAFVHKLDEPKALLEKVRQLLRS